MTEPTTGDRDRRKPSIRALQRAISLYRLESPDTPLNQAARILCDRSVVPDLSNAWLLAVVVENSAGGREPVILVSEPGSMFLQSVTRQVASGADLYLRVFRRVDRVREQARCKEMPTAAVVLRTAKHLTESLRVDSSAAIPGYVSGVETTRLFESLNWSQIEVNVGAAGAPILAILEFGHRRRLLHNDLDTLLQIVKRAAVGHSTFDPRRSTHALPPLDATWITAPDVHVPELICVAPSWNIDREISAAEAALEALLPDDEPRMQWKPSASAFSAFKKFDPADFVAQLRTNGWGAQTLFHFGPRGREFAFLTLAAHELLESDGEPDLEIAAAALTAYRRTLAERGKGLSAPDLRRVYALVNEAVFGARVANPFASAIAFPPPGSRKFKRLCDLIRLAPWVALLSQDAHNDLRVALTVEQLAEASAIGGRALAVDVSSTKTRSGEALANRFNATAGEVVLSPSVVATVVEAAASALQSPAQSHALLATLEGHLHERLIEVHSLWPPMATEHAEGVLRVWTDVHRQTAFAMNLSSDHHVEIQIGDDPSVVIRPFSENIEGEAGFASPLHQLSGTDAAIVAAGTVHSLFTRVHQPDLDTDSAASSVTPRHFLGREREVQLLRKWLLTSNPAARKPVVIYGNRRAGKTTLGRYVLRTAVREGLLSAEVMIDVIDGTGSDGASGAAYPPKLARALRYDIEWALRDANVPMPDIGDDIDDPVTLLRRLDRAWPSSTPPLGLLLDELDSLFHHRDDSAVYSLAARLGNLSLRNIALIGTVQRHGHEANVLKEWASVNCTATLSWGDSLRYFSGLDEPFGDGPIRAAYRPLLAPSTVATVVIPRLGYRPYFWGQLLTRLENVTFNDKTTIFDTDHVNRAIDEITQTDSLLALLTQRADGLTLTEARRQDVFNLDELALLAEFACSATAHLEKGRVAKVFGRHPEVINSLLEREMLTERGHMWMLCPGVFDEYVKARVALFARYLRPSPAVGQDVVVRPAQRERGIGTNDRPSNSGVADVSIGETTDTMAFVGESVADARRETLEYRALATAPFGDGEVGNGEGGDVATQNTTLPSIAVELRNGPFDDAWWSTVEEKRDLVLSTDFLARARHRVLNGESEWVGMLVALELAGAVGVQGARSYIESDDPDGPGSSGPVRRD